MMLTTDNQKRAVGAAVHQDWIECLAGASDISDSRQLKPPIHFDLGQTILGKLLAFISITECGKLSERDKCKKIFFSLC
jgi:hypothetical protein